mmetsp:Transcript_17545/g.44174  ORF Transcript_17545/g.44174 Transcript_17545/m.44174 type:complete len:224 (-) Transcript_17545:1025-1696(-)
MAFQLGLSADWQLDRSRDRTGAILDHVNTVEEVCADLVHLVDEHDPRNLVAVSLTPDRFGLRLNTGVCVEHANCAVEHGQGAFNFDREVNVSGRIDDVEAELGFVSRVAINAGWVYAVLGAEPERRGRSRRDRDATLLLLLHPVHRGSAIVDFTDLVRFTGVIENAFSRGRFTSIDVSHDAEVTITIQRIFAGHEIYLRVWFPGGSSERFSGALPAIAPQFQC